MHEISLIYLQIYWWGKLYPSSSTIQVLVAALFAEAIAEKQLLGRAESSGLGWSFFSQAFGLLRNG